MGVHTATAPLVVLVGKHKLASVELSMLKPTQPGSLSHRVAHCRTPPDAEETTGRGWQRDVVGIDRGQPQAIGAAANPTRPGVGLHSGSRVYW